MANTICQKFKGKLMGRLFLKSLLAGKMSSKTYCRVGIFSLIYVGESAKVIHRWHTRERNCNFQALKIILFFKNSNVFLSLFKFSCPSTLQPSWHHLLIQDYGRWPQFSEVILKTCMEFILLTSDKNYSVSIKSLIKVALFFILHKRLFIRYSFDSESGYQ